MKAPDWTREELILALNLYFKLDISWLRKLTGNSPEMVDLSKVLRNLSIHSVEKRQFESFRSSSSVHMKLMNFLRHDPKYGKMGLPNGSRLEQDIWDEFKNSNEKLKTAAEAILKKYLTQGVIKEVNESLNNPNDSIKEEYILLENLYKKIDQSIYEVDMLYTYFNEKRKDAASFESLEESQKVINEMYQKILKVNEWKAKLSEIKDAINIFEGNNKSMKVKEDISSEKTDIKIGKHVKITLSSYFHAKKFSETDISNMLDGNWTRSTLHISQPLLKVLDEALPVTEQRKVDGYFRYWNDIFTYDGRKYLACKEWFESNRKHFLEWAEKFSTDLDASTKISLGYDELRDEGIIKFSSKYSGITLKRSLLVFVLITIKEIDAVEVCIETSNLLKRVSNRIHEESNYKYPQFCVNNIIKFLTDAKVLVLHQNAKKGKFVIEDYEIMQKLIENPELVTDLKAQEWSFR